MLIHIPGHELLEPVVLHTAREGSTSVTVRRSLRKTSFDSTFAKNHLVYSDRLLEVPIKAIVRRCNVRSYTDDEIRAGGVPAIYSLGGTADC